MVYKNFRVQCAGRLVLLAATIYLFFYLLSQTTWYATVAVIGCIALYQIFALVHYVEKTNRDLTRFLQSIKHSDFSQTFTSSSLGSSFKELNVAFTEVLNEFRRARAEKEEHYRYLQTVVQHIGIGLLSFQPNGEVELINTAAKRLLNVAQLKNIRSLESLSRPLVDKLLQLKPGEKTLVKLEEDNESVQLAIYATEFKLRQQRLTLVSIQNIQSELEEKEMEAWQNLIRVLTHEIMNSVTPIASLASTVNDLLMEPSDDQEKGTETNSETMRDIRSAFQTIQKRSQGLLHFVDAYRNLTRIPKPNFQIFPVAGLFARVKQLMSAQIAEKTSHFHVNVEPESLELTADPELIEQVLINLLLNSVEAAEDKATARIEMTARMDERGRVVIQVVDNGPGIIEQAVEKIFIPFFTTKQDGSGIGLSLSRQIMRLHRGTIGVHSRPDVETIFSLRF